MPRIIELLSKYPATLIEDLPLSSVADLISNAFKLEKDQVAWELWKSMYPNMASEQQEYISLSDFKKKLFEKQIKYTEKKKEEIIDEMMAIRAKLR